MRVLHVLDHSIPLHSGYTFRTLALLREQRALGLETFHLTSPKHGAGEALEKRLKAGTSSVPRTQSRRVPSRHGP